MSKEFYVYQLRLENSTLPFYIGKGKGKRWKHHTKPSSLKPNAKTIRDNIIRKAQAEGIKIIPEKLCIDMTEQEALDLEVFLIAKLGRRDIGTGILANMTNGGDGISGYKFDKELTEKIAAQNRGKKWTDEQRANLKIVRQGQNAFNGMSPEVQQQTLARLTKQPQMCCIHCRKTCQYSLIVQWHGDKCKYKNKDIQK